MRKSWPVVDAAGDVFPQRSEAHAACRHPVLLGAYGRRVGASSSGKDFEPDLARAGPVEFAKEDPLPRPKRQFSVFEPD